MLYDHVMCTYPRIPILPTVVSRTLANAAFFCFVVFGKKKKIFKPPLLVNRRRRRIGGGNLIRHSERQEILGGIVGHHNFAEWHIR